MCVVCVFSQFAEDTNKERNMLIQITTSDSFFFKFLCLCITYFSPVPLPLSSPFEIQADTKKKKNQRYSDMLLFPQFRSPHPVHAVTPSAFIIRMTCFSRLKRTVLAINCEARSSPRHVESSDRDALKCFCCVTNRVICLRRRASRLYSGA